MKIKKMSKKRLILFLVLFVFVCSFVSTGIYSLAKYMTSDSKKSLAIPANFEFSSDYLKENNPSYNIYDWQYGISIELYNSININKSEINVPYTVTVTNGTSNVSSGTITTSENSDTIVITPTDIENPVIVSVTSSIYNYTLSATFNLMELGNNTYYTFVDRGNYSQLVIKTSSNNTNILSVNWDSNYIPDNNNPLMESWTTTSGILTLSPNSEYTLIFFEDVEEVHNAESAIVTGSAITLP